MVDSESKTALIFDVERFSTKDGPGIRTVVFFKGCNMRCYWCHNPEGLESVVSLKFDESKCIGCMACVNICPNNAHCFVQDHHYIDAEKCQRCMKCAGVCYSGALQRVGRNVTIDELFSEVVEDKVFYANSGGGVTLTGGEVMLQWEFVADFLSVCKKNGIHTAIETNMSLPWEKYEKVLPEVDLVMTDIKHMDEKAHQIGTGISNKHIVNNIIKLGEQVKPLIVRTPVIPGYNDSIENIQATAQFLKPIHSFLYYELLSYNPLGNSKGSIVGARKNEKDIPIPSKAHVKSLAQAAAEEGIKVFVDGREY